MTTTDAIQGLPLSSCTSADEGKDNRLLRILNLEPGDHSLYLEIPDTKHGINEIPLFTNYASTESSNPRPDKTDAENVLVQIFPLSKSYDYNLKSSFKPGEGPLKPLRKGWFYIYLNGRLWREFRISDTGVYREVALAHDERHLEDWSTDEAGTGVATQILIVPHKLGGVEQTVEVAHSEVRWTWERIQALGGFAANDTRSIHTDNKQAGDDQQRAARMTPLDLGSYIHQGQATTTDGELAICKASALPNNVYLHQLRSPDTAAIIIPDAMGYLTELALSYQTLWKDMHNTIETASQQPHYRSAALASQAFYSQAPKPELKFTGQRTKSTSRGPRQTHAYKAALASYNHRLDRWEDIEDLKEKVRDKIDHNTLEACLKTTQRHDLRAKILAAKYRLVNYLEQESIMLTQLVPELNDYCALPTEQTHFTNAMPCYGDLWGKFEQIFAKLGDFHICDADIGLDIDKIPPEKLETMWAKDVGNAFLEKFLEPEAFHVLQDYLLPIDVNPDRFNPDCFADAIQIGRRTTQFVTGFISHFTTAITNQVVESRTIRIETTVERAGVKVSTVHKPLINIPFLGGFFNRTVTIEEPTAPEKPTTTTTAEAENPKTTSPETVEKAQQGHNIDTVGEPETSTKTTVDIDDLNPEKNSVKERLKRLWKRLHVPTDQVPIPEQQKTTTTTQTVEQKVVVLPDNEISAKAYGNRAVVKGLMPVLMIFEMANIIQAVKVLKQEEWDTEDQLYLAGVAFDTFAIAADVLHLGLEYRFQSLALKNAAESAAIRSKMLIRVGVGAPLLGMLAGSYSTFISGLSAVNNFYSHDDAFISHGIMAAGFFAATVGSTKLFLAGLAAAKGAAGASSTVIGIWIGIGLALVAVGLILLSFVWTEDTVLEIWGHFGPFGKKAFAAGVQEEDTTFEIDPSHWADPQYADHAYEYLLNALYPIGVYTEHDATLHEQRRTNKRANNSSYIQGILGNKITTSVQFPYFLPGISQADITTMLEWEVPDTTQTGQQARDHFAQEKQRVLRALQQNEEPTPITLPDGGQVCNPERNYANCQDGDVLASDYFAQIADQGIFEFLSTYTERLQAPIQRLRLYNLTNDLPCSFIIGALTPTYTGHWNIDTIPMLPTEGLRVRTAARLDLFGDNSVQFPLRSFQDFQSKTATYITATDDISWFNKDPGHWDTLPTNDNAPQTRIG